MSSAAIYQGGGSEFSDVNSVNTPNGRSRHKTPAKRDVCLSVGQVGNRRSSNSHRSFTPLAPSRGRRGSSPSSNTNGRRPSVGRRASKQRGYYNLDVDDLSAPAAYPRGRTESPRPPFIVEPPPREPKDTTKKEKANMKEVDLRWRAELRSSDQKYNAEARLSNGAHRTHSMGSVYAAQQQRRNAVEHPPTLLEQEIPYDSIIVAKYEKPKRQEVEEKPPVIYAVKKQSTASVMSVMNVKNLKNVRNVRSTKPETRATGHKAEERPQAMRDMSAKHDSDDSSSIEQQQPRQQQQQQPRQQQQQPEQWQPERSGYDSIYEYEILDESDHPQPKVNEVVVEARRKAFQRWKERTASGMYNSVYVSPAACEAREVPPLFEPPLNAVEAQILSESANDDAVMDAYMEQVLRYRLATQTDVRKTNVEDIQMSKTEAAALVPIVRATRYHHEEENWQHALETLQRNRERAAQHTAEEAKRAAEYQSALTEYQMRSGEYERQARAAVPWNGEKPERYVRGSSPRNTSPRRNTPTSGLGTAAINSATTPGWIRHREFSGDEWDELRGRKSAPGSSRGQDGSLREGAGPRNPNQPAWMHRLNAAQAAEESEDPQLQKLNELESASSVGRQRQTVPVSYSIGQSQRMRASNDSASEESLSFGRSADASSAQYSVSRPTRLTANAAHPTVVENAVEVDEHDMSVSASMEVVPMDVAPKSLVPPTPPAPMGPVPVEKVVFCLYPFSSFEATQEMKRITWWCAARGVDTFTVRMGVKEDYSSSKVRQPRSYSPTFFPGVSRFYDEMLAMVTTDLWLRKRVTVAAHESDSGEVHLELTAATLREAAQQNWLMAAPAEQQSVFDGEYPLEGTRNNNSHGGGLDTLPPPLECLGSTAPPPPRSSEALGSTAAPVRTVPVMDDLRFFTDTPHPNGATVHSC